MRLALVTQPPLAALAAATVAASAMSGAALAAPNYLPLRTGASGNFGMSGTRTAGHQEFGNYPT